MAKKISKILSIIIPMYQSEAFIVKCLDSLLLDKRYMQDLEILVVNDGSKDASRKIAAGYQQRYPQSIRIIDRENGGHGAAINTGVQECQGKYFKVLDADDWVDAKGLQGVLRQLRAFDGLEEEVDVALAGFDIYDVRTKNVQHVRAGQRKPLRYLTMGQLMADWGRYKRLVSFHGVVFRTDFYRALPYRLPEGVYYDDACLIAVFVSCASSFCILNQSLYVYRVGCACQSTSKENRQKRMEQMERVLLSILDAGQDLERRGANMRFWRLRTGSYLADYFVTAFLRFTDRKTGRRLGRKFYRRVLGRDKRLGRAVCGKYLVLYIMGLLHLDEQAFQKMLDARPGSIHGLGKRLVKRGL